MVHTCLVAARKLHDNCTLKNCNATTAQNDEEMDFEGLSAAAFEMGNAAVHGNTLNPSHHDSRFFEASALTPFYFPCLYDRPITFFSRPYCSGPNRVACVLSRLGGSEDFANQIW